ncbi:transglycosylase SLT domain-containing protein [Alteromonas sp. ASW11-19]|uniref:Transglycosylase SLT domain-containing protein n=1 Tax=Alteromonas salexigens TaxID=2982530 RepID=A0ABT2VIL5_9ALTE|nr:transglycosylase SLT domain-containing protein [Alteromonas salexigens]MCU7552978.1 transglycosylase SLT domain-containing protein [Alteromonas salexigens]
MEVEVKQAGYIRRTGGWLVMLCLVVAGLADAAPLLPQDGKDAQREAFVSLEKAIHTTPTSKFPQLNSQFEALEGYPLYPYLVRQRLLRQLNIRQRNEVEQFLSAYDGDPFVYSFRRRWLQYLAEKGHKEAFLASYRDNMGAAITCQYLEYQLEEATNPVYWLSKVDDIWLSGQSQPNECDDLFARWREQGLMTDEKLLTRIRKAATGGNVRLVPYLQKRLADENYYLADLWEQVRRAPRTALKKSRFPLTNKAEEARILAYALERLAWQSADDAVKGYFLWQPKGVFNADQLTDIHRAIALSMAIDNHPDAREWLMKADAPGADEDVKRWHVAYLLRQQQWQQVLTVIGNAPDSRQDEDNFQYWRARSFDALGMPQQASYFYETLAGERSFYGFLASAKLAKKPSLMHRPTPRDPNAIAEIRNQPAAKRAYEFLQLGRLIDARREWRHLLLNLDSSRVKDAAILASEWGWYDQAIVSFARSGYWDDVERRFPLAYEPEFSSVGKTYNVPRAFAMAIARRESSFMSDAVSPAGATGLMQLMPGTAQYIAEQRVNRKTLFEPDKNLDFGVQYLRYLMDKLDDNPVLVSASYNAGWRRVLKWLPEKQALPTDIWIENIPYRETRHYVKAVLAYRYIYEQQLGEPSELFNELATRPIPAATSIVESQSTGQLQLAPQ